ncbi:MAG: type II secretion system protein [Kiritimatiellae bacterium]|nr:type II secretion system protein [Kiritimatiellia bacterium]
MGTSGGKRGRGAFTIVELLVVIAIIGVLLGIVTTAATSAMKDSRVRRADAMGKALQQAIAAYYAQEGKWPDPIESHSSSMGNSIKYTLSGDEADRVFREIVKNSVGSSASRPLVDASALFVADSGRLKHGGDGCFDNHGDRSSTSFCGDQRCANGVDFSLASRKDSKSHIPVDRMAFGWQGRTNGRFCRFWITYNSQADSVSVTRKHPGKSYPASWE